MLIWDFHRGNFFFRIGIDLDVLSAVEIVPDSKEGLKRKDIDPEISFQINWRSLIRRPFGSDDLLSENEWISVLTSWGKTGERKIDWGLWLGK